MNDHRDHEGPTEQEPRLRRRAPSWFVLVAVIGGLLLGLGLLAVVGVLA